jgi:hypothetical protein
MKINFIAIKTNDGYYFTDNINNKRYYDTKIINEKLKFDGEIPKKSFHPDWFIIKNFPKVITTEKYQPDINKRFELKDPDTFKNLPKIIKLEDVLIEKECNKNNWEEKYTEDFENKRGLYEYKSDPQPPEDIPIDFEFVIIGEMKKISGKVPFKYKIQKTQYEFEGTIDLTNNDIVKNLIDKIVTPTILHHTLPSRLTSHDTYKIIRQYIKQNIDLNYAVITSDYNFCFTVEKLIELNEIEEYIVNKNILTKRKPKYIKQYRKSRKVPIFEMTWSPECYRGYTPIKGFEGKNEKDLKIKIDKYLKDLINEINKPLIECPHCKGEGVILKKKIDINRGR